MTSEYANVHCVIGILWLGGGGQRSYNDGCIVLTRAVNEGPRSFHNHTFEVGFHQALVGTFCVIVKTSQSFVSSSIVSCLHLTGPLHQQKLEPRPGDDGGVALVLVRAHQTSLRVIRSLHCD